MEDKFRECFEEMSVYKNLRKSNFFSLLALPSFLRDWVLKRFEDDEGNYNIEDVQNFVNEYIPKKEDWIGIKSKIINDNQRIKILTKINVDIDIKTGEISFALPNFGLTNKETIIEPQVWEKYENELTKGQEIWGIVELGYRFPDDTAKPKIPGKIKMTSFISFCPYEVDLDYYKDVRSEFSIDEWIDIILGAIDYNAAGYKNENEKLTMLSRILPFCQKRLNLLELAPKGTGKSYVFGNLSKYGTLTGSAKVTRAKMFYDIGNHKPGFIMGTDYVAIDEIKLVTFNDDNEMRSILQGYMESGRFNVSGYEGESSAGIIFLGNIKIKNMDVYRNMFSELPPLFKESALVDRIHGFIKGWDIPEANENLYVSDWALNTEYFCTILHMLRDDLSYESIVNELVEVSPKNAYGRHVAAVKRIATAYLKLLFPNVRSADDIDPQTFNHYCLRPAVEMRKIIWKQMTIIDEEYKKDSKQMPTFSVKDFNLEI